MTREQLEHAIRAACNVSGDTELLIFGSQAIHGSIPNPSAPLTSSIEVDLQPKNKPEMTTAIDGTLGEGSPFHEEWGFYVQGVLIDVAILPSGWQKRTAPVYSENTRFQTGHCVEAHDLAASKLAAYRPKDKEFVATLLAESLINPTLLRIRIEELPIDDEHRRRLLEWLRITLEDIADG